MAPDQAELDSPTLRRSENLLPILGSWRPVKKLVEVSSQPSETDPILGGESILVTQPEPTYFVEPNRDISRSSGARVIMFPDPLYNINTNPVWEGLNGETPDDGDGFTNNPLGNDDGIPQVSAHATVGLEYPGRPPINDPTLVKFKVRYRWTMSKRLLDLGAVIFEGKWRLRVYEDGAIRFTFNNTDTGITPGEIIEASFSPSQLNFDSITDWSKVEVRLETQEINLLDVPPDLLQYQRILPTADVAVVTSGWTDELGGRENLYQKVSDLQGGSPVNTTYIVSPSISEAGDNSSILFALDRDAQDPRQSGLMPINVRAELFGSLEADTVRMRIELLAGDMRPKDSYSALSDPNTLTTIASVEHVLSPTGGLPSWADYLLSPSGSESRQIETYHDLYVRITTISNGPAPPLVPSNLRVSHIQLNMALQVTQAFSWLNVEWPTDEQFEPGDRSRVFVGTEEKIYEASESGWSDRTRVSGPYGLGGDPTAPSKGWDFTTWGDSMIATNYTDVPQIMNLATDSEFRDIIDLVANPNAVIPKGRFCAVVSEMLNLYDIKPDSPNTQGIGAPYTSWWSEQGNPFVYQIFNITNLSTYQNLTNTDGQIMSAVGGETGVVFKRNSIYRQSFLGYPRVFGFDILSMQEGTAYPKSPIPYKNNVYFWGNGMIGVVENYTSIRRISTRILEKFIFDTEFEEYAVRQRVSSDERINDQVCVGAYDSHSGLIWWAYSLKSDPDVYHKSAILICNPREERFALLTGENIGNEAESLGLNYVVGRKNSKGSDLSYAKGVYGFKSLNYFESGNRLTMERFTSGETYPCRMLTKTHSADQFPGVEPGRNMTINYVRPIFRGSPDSVVPAIEITLQAGETPWMQGNNEPSQTVTLSSANRDGWIPTRPLSGGFFDFTIEIPSISGGTMKEIMGLQFDYQTGGQF